MVCELDHAGTGRYDCATNIEKRVESLLKLLVRFLEANDESTAIELVGG